jgi:hypothetical protein
MQQWQEWFLFYMGQILAPWQENINEIWMLFSYKFLVFQRKYLPTQPFQRLGSGFSTNFQICTASIVF